MYEHLQKVNSKSFSKRYNLSKLVWYENYVDIIEAIAREKQIKAGSRAKKEALITAFNPEWKDLSETVYFL